jgi:hypothetical protein
MRSRLFIFGHVSIDTALFMQKMGLTMAGLNHMFLGIAPQGMPINLFSEKTFLQHVFQLPLHHNNDNDNYGDNDAYHEQLST